MTIYSPTDIAKENKISRSLVWNMINNGQLIPDVEIKTARSKRVFFYSMPKIVKSARAHKE